MDRAYAILTVKSVSDDQRIIEGMATTPTPDRLGDVIEPKGVLFKNPLPLLWQHHADKPIGTVEFSAPTKDGIKFKAKLPNVTDPGTLKERLDEAWQSIKAGLVRGVSIGFRPVRGEIEAIKDGGVRFLKTEVYEMSLVTIPANAEATITTIKSVDTYVRAASGRKDEGVTRTPPGVTGNPQPVSLRPKEGTQMKTIAEQITALEAKRAANAARMEEVIRKSIDEGRSTDAAEQEEFDTLETEVSAIDEDLRRLKSLEKAKATTAKPIKDVLNPDAGSQARASVVVKAPPVLPPGVQFARVVKCIGLARGNIGDAFHIAEIRFKDDDKVINVLKTAVAAGTVSAETWAGPLVGEETSVFADFVEFLRPQTIIGRFGTGNIPSLRRVPFRTPLIGQTSGGDGYWVGEGKAKPLTKFDFERKTLDPLKVANIAVVTMELLRDSSPSAEIILRDQLAEALKARLDTDFVDPTKTASAGVSPASITQGVTPIASTGIDADAVREDIRLIFAAFIADNNAPTNGVWLMPATVALALSLMMNPLGQPEFPGLNMNGGTLSGLPVLTSEYVPTDVSAASYVILANASDIYLADDGGVSVDMSREASLEMADNPSHNSSTPTPAQLVSLWQTNSVGFRAERTINWLRRRSGAVQVLSGVHWGQPA